jgi:hypothetical protein
MMNKLDGNRLQVEYDLTAEDVVTLSLFHYKHSPTVRRSWLMLRVVVPIIWILIGFFENSRERHYAGIAPLPFFISLSVLYILLMPAYSRYRTRRITLRLLSEGKNKGFDGPHSLTIGPEGIVAESATGDARSNWSVVEKLETDKEHFYIYTSAVNAIILPKRAFADENEFQEFVASVQTYYKNANS